MARSSSTAFWARQTYASPASEYESYQVSSVIGEGRWCHYSQRKHILQQLQSLHTTISNYNMRFEGTTHLELTIDHEQGMKVKENHNNKYTTN